ncbi:MAG: DUF3782 domain-containing protein [bacterium]
MTTLEKLEDLIYRGFKETDQRLDQRFQETERRFRETERFIKENAAQQKELKKDYWGLIKSLGLFAESMVEPAVIGLFNERGIKLTGVSGRMKERMNGDTMEVDVVGTSPDTVVVIEVKLRLELPDVKEFLKELHNFFKFFPRFRGSKLYGAVAGMSIEKGAARYAYKKGLFVLGPSEDNVKILNDEKFIPRAFNGSEKKPARKKR